MQSMEILGEKIWRCGTDEVARQLWQDHPADRHRIWTESEVAAHLCDSPEQLTACLAAKREKPGRLAPVDGQRGDTTSCYCPTSCRGGECWCSERGRCGKGGK